MRCLLWRRQARQLHAGGREGKGRVDVEGREGKGRYYMSGKSVGPEHIVSDAMRIYGDCDELRDGAVGVHRIHVYYSSTRQKSLI